MDPSTSASGGFEGHCSSRDDSDWHFLQCFGERTPGEEIQDGEAMEGYRGSAAQQRRCTATTAVKKERKQRNKMVEG